MHFPDSYLKDSTLIYFSTGVEAKFKSSLSLTTIDEDADESLEECYQILQSE